MLLKSNVMKPTGKLKIAIMAIMAAILSCGTANAQRWHRHYRPYRVVTVVSRPARTVHVTNSFTQKERFGMAMAYLKNHGYLTVKKYAKMTGLTKTAAEAEPDAPLVEKERPKMDALTHKLFIQYRRMPTEANKQALLERMGIRYDKVVARKKNCRTEKSDVARDCSKGYADVGFRVVKVTLR